MTERPNMAVCGRAASRRAFATPCCDAPHTSTVGRKETSMDAESKVYRGSCHCGAVEFQAKSNLAQTFRCNCSLCRRKGAVMTIVNPEDFALLNVAA